LEGGLGPFVRGFFQGPRRLEAPLLSVVVPAYNVAPYLGRALGSLANQTAKDLEVIVVDDGSTDGSGEVALRILEGSDLDWKLVSQTNRGVSAARNVGLSLCRGLYVLFLDGDDWLCERVVEVLSRVVLYRDYDVVAWGFNLIRQTPRGDLVPIRARESGPRSLETKGVPFLLEFVEDFLARRVMKIHISSCAFRVGAVKSMGLEFPEGICCGEDVNFIFKFLIACDTAKFLDEKLLFRLLRPGSITSERGNLSLFQDFYAIEDVLRFLEEMADRVRSGFGEAVLLELRRIFLRLLVMNFFTRIRLLVRDRILVDPMAFRDELDARFPDILPSLKGRSEELKRLGGLRWRERVKLELFGERLGLYVAMLDLWSLAVAFKDRLLPGLLEAAKGFGRKVGVG